MKVYDAASIRNVALVGHSGSGKTQLASAILSDAGMVNRFGKVDDGTTVTDFDEEEIARKHTLSASLAYAEWNKHEDQPDRHAGHRQLPRATRAPRCTSPTPRSSSSTRSPASMVQTEKVWAAADELGLPRLVVLNRLDRERASLERSLAVAARVVQPHGHPDSAADRRREGVQGRRRSRRRRRRSSSRPTRAASSPRAPVPADMAGAVDAAREALIEMVAEADEKLMEKFFEAGTLTDEELVAGLRSATIAGKMFPLVCTSATAEHRRPAAARRDRRLPAVAGRAAVQGTRTRRRRGRARRPTRRTPPAAFVWKTIADPFAGRITMFRVVSGIAQGRLDGPQQDAGTRRSGSAT